MYQIQDKRNTVYLACASGDGFDVGEEIRAVVSSVVVERKKKHKNNRTIIVQIFWLVAHE